MLRKEKNWQVVKFRVKLILLKTGPSICHWVKKSWISLKVIIINLIKYWIGLKIQVFQRKRGKSLYHSLLTLL